MADPTFNRLALAAALLEYDNDIDDPHKEYVDHRRSAMFRGLDQRRPPTLAPLAIPSGSREDPRRDSEHSYRSGSDPNSASGLTGNTNRRTWLTGRPLPNPPQRSHSHHSDLDIEELEEVDIGTSWRNSGSRSSFDASAMAESQGARRRPPQRHTVSLHEGEGHVARAHSVHIEHIDDGEDFAESALRESERVQRLADDSEGRRSSIAALTLEDGGRDPVMVPLGDGSSYSPIDQPGRPHSAMSANARSRMSNASPVPVLGMEEHDEEILKNPFELPAPPMEMGSRFDPKTVEAQRRSIDLSRVESRTSLYSGEMVSGSQFRGSMHSRQGSGSVVDSVRGSYYGENQDDWDNRDRRVYEDIPMAEEYGKPLRPPKYGQFSQAYQVHRRKLLQPRTLHMPSPLEGTEKETRTVYVPEGFEIGEKPLPSDARASILNQGKGVPLSLAQRTFASSLMVGGVRDAEYFAGQADEGETLMGITAEERAQEAAERRGPGKLYGKSLIDQLEARKNQLQNKKRVFYGDNRPNMMARQSVVHEPQALSPPKSEAGGLSPPKASISARPLTYAPGSGVPELNLPEGDGGDARKQRIVNSRSVFGVDTVWEAEMAKLKTMQEEEAYRKANEERFARVKEMDKALRADRRFSRWGNKHEVEIIESDPNFTRPVSWHPNMLTTASNEQSPRGSTSDTGRPSTTDRPPTVNLDLDQGDLTIEAPAERERLERRPASKLGVEDWFSSDDESPNPQPRAKTITAAKVMGSSPQLPQLPSMRRMPSGSTDSDSDSDSDADVPLSRLRVVDSDEEVPLSQIRKGKGTGAPSLPTFSSTLPALSLNDGALAPAEPAEDKDKDKDIESDDEPLFLRRSMLRPAEIEDAEDDLPLGWKHAGAVASNSRAQSYFPPQSQSFYGQPGYMGPMGMPQMGMPMGPPMMGMGGMGGMQMGGMPPMNMGPMAPEPPNPGKNIDNWRKQVLAPERTGTSAAASG